MTGFNLTPDQTSAAHDWLDRVCVWYTIACRHADVFGEFETTRDMTAIDWWKAWRSGDWPATPLGKLYERQGRLRESGAWYGWAEHDMEAKDLDRAVG